MPRAITHPPGEDWWEYCQQDVNIIRRAVLALREFVVAEELGKMQPTIASQAMSAFRQPRFLQHQVLVHANSHALGLEREGFHGGRTEAFYRGRIETSLFKLDINSMYPTIMRSQPVGYHFEGHFPRFKSSWWADALEGSVVARCRVKTDAPVYGVVRTLIDGEWCDTPHRAGAKRLIFPVGEFETVLTTPEVRYAQEHAHLQDVGEFALYRAAPIFRDYVDYFYRKRWEFQDAGNQIFAGVCKLLLNSLYGKMGQTGKHWESNPDLADEWLALTGGVMQNYDGSITHARYRLGQFQTLTVDPESHNSCPIIAAEITAHGRVWLWELCALAGEGNVFYTDTDSLIVNAAGYANLEHLIDPRRLGALKLEGITEFGNFMAPKHYAFGADEKTKGVRRNHLRRLSDRAFIQPQFGSWDSMLSHGEDGFVRVSALAKTVTGENSKRVVTGDGWTNAILLRE
jgi:hypothetical protein